MFRQATRVLAAFSCMMAWSLALVLGATSPGNAQPQAITIDSTLAVKVRPYAPIYKIRPFASVVLLAGGKGVLDLNATGDIRDLQRNFLIRSARRFLNSRLFNGLVNVPAAQKAQRMTVAGVPNVAVSACSAFHHHGYNGVEQMAVTEIVKVIKKNSS